jgi:hypothetical protein
MRTYVKIQGNAEEIKEAIKKLEKIAVETPRICVMDTIIDQEMPSVQTTYLNEQWARSYFNLEAANVERCATIVSKTEKDLSDSDLYFEWLSPPNSMEIDALRKKIDNALKPQKYKITNKN